MAISDYHRFPLLAKEGLGEVVAANSHFATPSYSYLNYYTGGYIKVTRWLIPGWAMVTLLQVQDMNIA